MTDFLITTDNAVVSAEHVTKRSLGGSDLESINEKLTNALEQLNYTVLSTGPIIARRSQDKKRTGKIFNIPIRLTVAIRPATERMFTATFHYHMQYSAVYKGDIATIEREVDAIVALAYQRHDTGNCSVCGTSNSYDSRFCRLCGSQSAGRVPAELEILRLNAEIRTGHRAVIGGFLAMVISLPVAAGLIIWGNPKGVNFGWGLLLVSQAISWLTMLFGVYVTHIALNPRATPSIGTAPAQALYEPSAAPASLTTPAAVPSVTEHTTRSLSTSAGIDFAEPRRNTFEMIEDKDLAN